MILGYILTVLGYFVLILFPLVILWAIVGSIRDIFKGNTGSSRYPYPLNKCIR